MQDRPTGLGTVKQVAVYLGVSRASVYAIMDRGELPYCKLGKSRRIRWTDVVDMVERQTVGAQGAA